MVQNVSDCYPFGASQSSAFLTDWFIKQSCCLFASPTYSTPSPTPHPPPYFDLSPFALEAYFPFPTLFHSRPSISVSSSGSVQQFPTRRRGNQWMLGATSLGLLHPSLLPPFNPFTPPSWARPHPLHPHMTPNLPCRRYPAISQKHNGFLCVLLWTQAYRQRHEALKWQPQPWGINWTSLCTCVYILKDVYVHVNVIITINMHGNTCGSFVNKTLGKGDASFDSRL